MASNNLSERLEREARESVDTASVAGAAVPGGQGLPPSTGVRSASLPRHAAHVGAERQELLDAVKHGRKEPANPGEDGRQRWK